MKIFKKLELIFEIFIKWIYFKIDFNNNWNNEKRDRNILIFLFQYIFFEIWETDKNRIKL